MNLTPIRNDPDIKWPKLTLQDFDSNKVKIDDIPKVVSGTCQGQKLLRPVTKLIPFVTNYNLMDPKTIKEFNINKHEQEIH